MAFESPEDFLRYVLRAVAPYREDLVLVGGFAVWLYRFHPRAAAIELIPLLTFDVDFAAPERLHVAAGRNLSDLIAAAGLDQHLLGGHVPPVAKFVPRNVGKPVEAGAGEQYCMEFLTPLVGSATNRRGEEVGTKVIQPGITAQRLRFLDLLLADPWRVPVAAIPGMDGDPEGVPYVKVPHPGLMIVQKVLIFEERRRHGGWAKDMAYIYEVLGIFRHEIPRLAQEVRAAMATNNTWDQWLERFRRMSQELFGTPNAPGVTGACEVLARSAAGGDCPTHAMVHAGVQEFLREL